MKNGWTTHSSNNAIWLALSPCHMTMTCKINKLEKPGGQLRIFHTLFGRSAAFYGHFRVDTVTSEWSTRISSSILPQLYTISTHNASFYTLTSGSFLHLKFTTVLGSCLYSLQRFGYISDLTSLNFYFNNFVKL